MLRVGVFPADHGGCGYYRVIWPWTEIARLFPNEIEVVWASQMQDDILLAWEGGSWGEGEPTEYHTAREIVKFPDIDVAVFQRPLHHKYIEHFRLLRERGIVIVVDIDDNFDRISYGNIAWHAVEPHWMANTEIKKLATMFGEVTVTKKTLNEEWYFSPAHSGAIHRKNIHAALRNVDLLITSTPDLAQHYSGMAGHTAVIDNYVPPWYLEKVRLDENLIPVVGWTGSIGTHPRDLQEMGGALSKIRRTDDVNFIFKVVGTGVGIDKATGELPDETTGGWVDLTDGSYIKEYASFDVALCPLEDSPFNRGKSWLKGIEAASVGVVPVMSPLPEYRRLHADGVGVLAKKPRDWERRISALLTDVPYRTELAQRGQEVVRDKYTLDKNVHRWVEVILDVMKRTARVSA